MGSLLQTERARHAGGISALPGYGSLSNLNEYESQWSEARWNNNALLVGLDEPQYSSPTLESPEPGSYESAKRSKPRSYKPQGRLHKRASVSSTGPHRRATVASTPDLVTYRDTTPQGSHLSSDSDLDAVLEQSVHHNNSKIRGDNLRKNLRWLTQSRDSARSNTGDLKDEIDLSRTAAENEERSGLGIAIPAPSRTTDSPMHGDDGYASAISGTGPIRLHVRSTSHNSTSSQTASTNFKPTVPFVHPIHQSPRPGLPTSHSNSYVSDRSSEASTHPGGESVASPFPARSRGDSYASVFTSRARDASDASATRPPLKLNTSNASSGRASASATPTLRSRRGTNMSSMSNMSRPEMSTPDIMSPSSRTSMDRALSFMRRDTDPVDPLTRAASIQAARQAFQEREDAKTLKYEQQERKAAERREQAAVKIEERKRRKSDAAVRKQAIETEKRRRQSDAAATAERIRSNSNAINEKALTSGRRLSDTRRKIKAAPYGLHREPVPALMASERVKSEHAGQTADDVQFPRVSRKRAAKSGYLRFWTWFKTRLLRIGQAHRRS